MSRSLYVEQCTVRVVYGLCKYGDSVLDDSVPVRRQTFQMDVSTGCDYILSLNQKKTPNANRRLSYKRLMTADRPTDAVESDEYRVIP